MVETSTPGEDLGRVLRMRGDPAVEDVAVEALKIPGGGGSVMAK